MLSYDMPAPVNGQNPPTTTNTMSSSNSLPTGVPTAPDAVRPAPDSVPNGLTTTGTAVQDGFQTKHKHIWLVTGPAGCGKSTVAQALAQHLNMPYIEGDEFHPPANIEKMSHGIPLTDADRWDWLIALRVESVRHLEAGNHGVVLTCSALKRKYRDVIRVAPYFAPGVSLHFIYLSAPEEVLLQRVGARQGHYMGANMVHSQFSILEPPMKDELDVISIDVSRTSQEVVDDVLARVEQTMKTDE